jgi:hypothetical protein
MVNSLVNMTDGLEVGVRASAPDVPVGGSLTTSAALVDRTSGVRVLLKLLEDSGRRWFGDFAVAALVGSSGILRGITCSFVPGSTLNPGAPNIHASKASVSSFVSLTNLPCSVSKSPVGGSKGEGRGLPAPNMLPIRASGERGEVGEVGSWEMDELGVWCRFPELRAGEVLDLPRAVSR